MTTPNPISQSPWPADNGSTPILPHPPDAVSRIPQEQQPGPLNRSSAAPPTVAGVQIQSTSQTHRPPPASSTTSLSSRVSLGIAVSNSIANSFEHAQGAAAPVVATDEFPATHHRDAGRFPAIAQSAISIGVHGVDWSSPMPVIATSPTTSGRGGFSTRENTFAAHSSGTAGGLSAAGGAANTSSSASTLHGHTTLHAVVSPPLFGASDAGTVVSAISLTPSPAHGAAIPVGRLHAGTGAATAAILGSERSTSVALNHSQGTVSPAGSAFAALPPSAQGADTIGIVAAGGGPGDDEGRTMTFDDAATERDRRQAVNDNHNALPTFRGSSVVFGNNFSANSNSMLGMAAAGAGGLTLSALTSSSATNPMHEASAVSREPSAVVQLLPAQPSAATVAHAVSGGAVAPSVTDALTPPLGLRQGATSSPTAPSAASGGLSSSSATTHATSLTRSTLTGVTLQSAVGARATGGANPSLAGVSVSIATTTGATSTTMTVPTSVGARSSSGVAFPRMSTTEVDAIVAVDPASPGLVNAAVPTADGSSSAGDGARPDDLAGTTRGAAFAAAALSLSSAGNDMLTAAGLSTPAAAEGGHHLRTANLGRSPQAATSGDGAAAVSLDFMSMAARGAAPSSGIIGGSLINATSGISAATPTGQSGLLGFADHRRSIVSAGSAGGDTAVSALTTGASPFGPTVLSPNADVASSSSGHTGRNVTADIAPTGIATPDAPDDVTRRLISTVEPACASSAALLEPSSPTAPRECSPSATTSGVPAVPGVVAVPVAPPLAMPASSFRPYGEPVASASATTTTAAVSVGASTHQQMRAPLLSGVALALPRVRSVGSVDGAAAAASATAGGAGHIAGSTGLLRRKSDLARHMQLAGATASWLHTDSTEHEHHSGSSHATDRHSMSERPPLVGSLVAAGDGSPLPYPANASASNSSALAHHHHPSEGPAGGGIGMNYVLTGGSSESPSTAGSPTGGNLRSPSPTVYPPAGPLAMAPTGSAAQGQFHHGAALQEGSSVTSGHCFSSRDSHHSACDGLGGRAQPPSALFPLPPPSTSSASGVPVAATVPRIPGFGYSSRSQSPNCPGGAASPPSLTGLLPRGARHLPALSPPRSTGAPGSFPHQQQGGGNDSAQSVPVVAGPPQLGLHPLRLSPRTTNSAGTSPAGSAFHVATAGGALFSSRPLPRESQSPPHPAAHPPPPPPPTGAAQQDGTARVGVAGGSASWHAAPAPRLGRTPSVSSFRNLPSLDGALPTTSGNHSGNLAQLARQFTSSASPRDNVSPVPLHPGGANASTHHQGGFTIANSIVPYASATASSGSVTPTTFHNGPPVFAPRPPLSRSASLSCLVPTPSVAAATSAVMGGTPVTTAVSAGAGVSPGGLLTGATPGSAVTPTSIVGGGAQRVTAHLNFATDSALHAALDGFVHDVRSRATSLGAIEATTGTTVGAGDPAGATNGAALNPVLPPNRRPPPPFFGPPVSALTTVSAAAAAPSSDANVAAPNVAKLDVLHDNNNSSASRVAVPVVTAPTPHAATTSARLGTPIATPMTTSAATSACGGATPPLLPAVQSGPALSASSGISPHHPHHHQNDRSRSTSPGLITFSGRVGTNQSSATSTLGGTVNMMSGVAAMSPNHLLLAPLTLAATAESGSPSVGAPETATASGAGSARSAPRVRPSTSPSFRAVHHQTHHGQLGAGGGGQNVHLESPSPNRPQRQASAVRASGRGSDGAVRHDEGTDLSATVGGSSSAPRALRSGRSFNRMHSETTIRVVPPGDGELLPRPSTSCSGTLLPAVEITSQLQQQKSTLRALDGFARALSQRERSGTVSPPRSTTANTEHSGGGAATSSSSQPHHPQPAASRNPPGAPTLAFAEILDACSSGDSDDDDNESCSTSSSSAASARVHHVRLARASTRGVMEIHEPAAAAVERTEGGGGEVHPPQSASPRGAGLLPATTPPLTGAPTPVSNGGAAQLPRNRSSSGTSGRSMTGIAGIMDLRQRSTSTTFGHLGGGGDDPMSHHHPVLFGAACGGGAVAARSVTPQSFGSSSMDTPHRGPAPHPVIDNDSFGIIYPLARPGCGGSDGADGATAAPAVGASLAGRAPRDAPTTSAASVVEGLNSVTRPFLDSAAMDLRSMSDTRHRSVSDAGGLSTHTPHVPLSGALRLLDAVPSAAAVPSQAIPAAPAGGTAATQLPPPPPPPTMIDFGGDYVSDSDDSGEPEAYGDDDDGDTANTPMERHALTTNARSSRVLQDALRDVAVAGSRSCGAAGTALQGSITALPGVASAGVPPGDVAPRSRAVSYGPPLPPPSGSAGSASFRRFSHASVGNQSLTPANVSPHPPLGPSFASTPVDGFAPGTFATASGGGIAPWARPVPLVLRHDHESGTYPSGTSSPALPLSPQTVTSGAGGGLTMGKSTLVRHKGGFNCSASSIQGFSNARALAAGGAASGAGAGVLSGTMGGANPSFGSSLTANPASPVLLAPGRSPHGMSIGGAGLPPHPHPHGHSVPTNPLPGSHHHPHTPHVGQPSDHAHATSSSSSSSSAASSDVDESHPLLGQLLQRVSGDSYNARGGGNVGELSTTTHRLGRSVLTSGLRRPDSDDDEDLAAQAEELTQEVHDVAMECRSMINLSKLSLRDAALPSEIMAFTWLTELALAENKLVRLPDDFFTPLTNLVKVDLTENRLVTAPSSLFRLPKVQRILLDHNQISFLPKIGPRGQLLLSAPAPAQTASPSHRLRNALATAGGGGDATAAALVARLGLPPVSGGASFGGGGPSVSIASPSMATAPANSMTTTVSRLLQTADAAAAAQQQSASVAGCSTSTATAGPPQTLALPECTLIGLEWNRLTDFPSHLLDICPKLDSLFLSENAGVLSLPPPLAFAGTPMHPRAAPLKLRLDNRPPLMRALAEDGYDTTSHLDLTWNKIYPDRVLDFLYLGSIRTVQSPEVYTDLNIGFILTAARNLDVVVPPNIQHLELPLDDLPGEDVQRFFDQASQFIDAARDAHKGVLIHCFAGLSRSVTITVAYLMSRLRLTRDDAFALVKKSRPSAHPNEGFLERLLWYQDTLFREAPIVDAATTPTLTAGAERQVSPVRALQEMPYPLPLEEALESYARLRKIQK